MKLKNILIFISGFVLSLILTLTIFIYLSKNEGVLNNDNNLTNNLISIMLQKEDGNFEKTSKTEWPSEGYRFNKDLSKCANGSELSWINNKVVVTTNTTDKCYVYFNNNKFVEDLSGNNHHKNKIL